MNGIDKMYMIRTFSALALLMVVLFGAAWFATFSGSGRDGADIALNQETEGEFFINPFDAISVEAKAAYVYDVTTGEVLFARSEEQQLPLASLTKLMTALVAHESLGKREVVEVTPQAIAQEGASGLSEGQQWKLSELLKIVLVTSSNDGAYAVASASGGLESFTNRMNTRASGIGLSQTFYTNPTGLDQSITVSGSYGSARDMAELLIYIAKNAPTLLEATALPASIAHAETGETLEIENTNEALSRIPGLIGGKTGFTNLAGGNLAILFDAGLNHPIAIVVLGSSEAGRFTDVTNLTRASLRYLEKANSNTF